MPQCDDRAALRSVRHRSIVETVCLCTEWCCCTSLQPARRPTTFNQAGAQPPHEGRLADASGGERPEAFQLDRQEARGNVHAAFDVPVRRCRYSSQIAASSHGFGLVPELTGAQGRRSARIDLHRDQACSDRFSCASNPTSASPARPSRKKRHRLSAQRRTETRRTPALPTDNELPVGHASILTFPKVSSRMHLSQRCTTTRNRVRAVPAREGQPVIHIRLY